MALNGIKLLLVDDELEFLQPLMRRMKKRNVNVTAVNSGQEALAYQNAQGEDPAQNQEESQPPKDKRPDRKLNTIFLLIQYRLSCSATQGFSWFC